MSLSISMDVIWICTKISHESAATAALQKFCFRSVWRERDVLTNVPAGRRLRLVRLLTNDFTVHNTAATKRRVGVKKLALHSEKSSLWQFCVSVSRKHIFLVPGISSFVTLLSCRHHHRIALR